MDTVLQRRVFSIDYVEEELVEKEEAENQEEEHLNDKDAAHVETPHMDEEIVLPSADITIFRHRSLEGYAFDLKPVFKSHQTH